MAQQAKEKTDWVVPVAIVAGAAGVITGIVFIFKGMKGVNPGDEITAKFTFEYAGDGGTYVLQVSLGNILAGDWFDHIEGLTWSKEVTLPGPDVYTEELKFTLPDGITPQKYDAEALIRTSAMSTYDYLVKILGSKALNVKKA